MKTQKINSWHIETGYTATFESDDFDRWFLEGADRETRVTRRDERGLFENCIYLASAEYREMSQTASELKTAIREWADEWNSKISK